MERLQVTKSLNDVFTVFFSAEMMKKTTPSPCFFWGGDGMCHTGWIHCPVIYFVKNIEDWLRFVLKWVGSLGWKSGFLCDFVGF